MLKSDVTFDRLVTTFVPGALFVSGAFYMHRPILMKYFPFVAGYATQVTDDALGPQAKIILFSLAAICMGVIFDQLSDLAVIAVVDGEHDSGRPRQRRRTFARKLNRLFTLKSLSDIRRTVLERYLASNRREAFLNMVQRWAYSNVEEIQRKGSAGIIHQHILLRFRTLSQHCNSLYREIYAPLASAATLYCSLVALFVLSILSPFSAMAVMREIKIYSWGTYAFFILSAYGGVFLTAYNLKRRIRHFFSQSVTLAFQAFCAEASEDREGSVEHARPDIGLLD
ncbi:MAG TPA: hypothetical protein VN851_12560 [Thermoanaerobaculia bacterium]|nr:hypothetical protein [Thermoanaerobaculia bacterium]